MSNNYEAKDAIQSYSLKRPRESFEAGSEGSAASEKRPRESFEAGTTASDGFADSASSEGPAGSLVSDGSPSSEGSAGSSVSDGSEGSAISAIYASSTVSDDSAISAGSAGSAGSASSEGSSKCTRPDWKNRDRKFSKTEVANFFEFHILCTEDLFNHIKRRLYILYTVYSSNRERIMTILRAKGIINESIIDNINGARETIVSMRKMVSKDTLSMLKLLKCDISIVRVNTLFFIYEKIMEFHEMRINLVSRFSKVKEDITAFMQPGLRSQAEYERLYCELKSIYDDVKFLMLKEFT
jgi:hypothetical protein